MLLVGTLADGVLPPRVVLMLADGVLPLKLPQLQLLLLLMVDGAVKLRLLQLLRLAVGKLFHLRFHITHRSPRLKSTTTCGNLRSTLVMLGGNLSGTFAWRRWRRKIFLCI